MTGPATGTVMGAASAATIMSFMPFGVSFETLVLGGICYFSGACARTGLILYKKLDGTNDTVNVIRPIAALLCTVPIAAVASCIVFLGAHVMGLNADAALGGVLLITGLRGPEGFQWLIDTFTNIFTKVIPSGKSEGNGP